MSGNGMSYGGSETFVELVLKEMKYLESEDLVLEFINVDRTLLRHSKEYCKEGVVEQKEEAKHAEEENRGGSNESDPYGPWMHVSHGIIHRNNSGSRYSNWGTFDGKQNGNQGNGGKVRIDAKQSCESHVVGEDKTGQDMGHINSMNNTGIVRHVKNSAVVTKNNRMNPRKANGSRFTVLSDNTDVEDSDRELQRHAGT
ncbi:hypothetical protein LWI29_002660 [Acer saccharum]|uniref:Uncharacterized protein n=1 Tax=Acer saccharum TaxID=4024 RepID=A0AA39S3E7_ACESA|nr:hypothetical protein LWI29_002660 [Acer saccharum]